MLAGFGCLSRDIGGIGARLALGGRPPPGGCFGEWGLRWAEFAGFRGHSQSEYAIGCSESSECIVDSEIGPINRAETVLERPLKTDKEPAHLVEAFSKIMAEIDRQNPDSAKVVAAWEIAAELAEYGGVMADVFGVMNDIAAEVEFQPEKYLDWLVQPPTMAKTTPCEEACHDAAWTAAYNAVDDLNLGMAGCGAVWVVGMVVSGDVGVLEVTLLAGVCAGLVALDYYVEVGRIQDTHSTCLMAFDQSAGAVVKQSAKRLER